MTRSIGRRLRGAASLFLIVAAILAVSHPAVAGDKPVGSKKITGHIPFLDKPFRPRRPMRPMVDYRFDMRLSPPTLHYETENAYARFMRPPAPMALGRLDIIRYGF
jgi:hypothetical protein